MAKQENGGMGVGQEQCKSIAQYVHDTDEETYEVTFSKQRALRLLAEIGVVVMPAGRNA